MIRMFKDGNDNEEDPPRASKQKRISKERRPNPRASNLKRISKQRLRTALKRKRISKESLRASKRISKESLGAASASAEISKASKHVQKQRFFYWVPGSTVDPDTCPHPLTTRGICQCCWKLLPSVCPLPSDLMLE
ncbi:hypothetical protein ACJRO7_018018, partial [Eucalyptus globulus]